MRIHHIAMYVKDLEEAKNFFIKYFGAVSGEGYCNPNTKFSSYFLSFTANGMVTVQVSSSHSS